VSENGYKTRGGESSESGVTIRDVARKAGVSVATVSRVVNGLGSVRPETRRRVVEAIEALGFAPNPAARLLSGRSHKTIGALVPSFSDSFFAQAVRGLDDALSSAGYGLILACSDGSDELEETQCENLLSKGVDALVFLRGGRGTDYLAEKTSARIPVISVDREASQGGWGSVTSNDHRGASQMTARLLSMGHRRIAYLRGPDHVSTYRDRFQGFLEEMESLKGEAEPLMFQGDLSYEGGYALTSALLAQRVTAVFCANDYMAIGVIRGLQDGGVLVPAQVAVAGYGDQEIGVMIRPTLSTVSRPAYRMGVAASELLLDSLLKGSDLAGRNVVFSPSVVERDSTGWRRSFP
jgi:LacI family transcriptional regulator